MEATGILQSHYVSRRGGLSSLIKKRIYVYCLTFFILWPLTSLITAAIDADKTRAIRVPDSVAFLAATGGTILLLPNFIIIGTILMVPCLVFFAFLDSRRLLQPFTYRASLVLEPVLLFFSCLFDLLLYYPALCNYPLLALFRSLPVWLATLSVGLVVAIFAALYATEGNRFKVALTILLTGFLLVSCCEFRSSHRGGHYALKPNRGIVLLGLDSLSHSDDLSLILNWAKSHQGTPYHYAVTPGLLTNSVWTSLMTMRPISSHGVFHAFQSINLEKEQTIVDRARSQGYRTVSIFPDQFSCWISSEEEDFDVHLDGPIGWRHIATNSVENKSILLPLLLPVLPEVPFSPVPKNHIGTYNYDLAGGLEEIFSFQGKTFVASHHTYLHANRYPKYSELSREEIFKVLRAKVRDVYDNTFDWQGLDSANGPLPIREWKIAHLQKSLIAAIQRTNFLKNGGHLVIFSDHGNRVNLNDNDFRDPVYHHVLFITCNLPVYSDPEAPVSLLDIPGIIGLTDYHKSPPVVEFTLSGPAEWSKLIKSAKLGWNGIVELDKGLLSQVFKRLKTYQPYPVLSAPAPASAPVPSSPRASLSGNVLPN
jgi:hypothetical protein